VPDETALLAELRSGERLLWSGRPDPSVLFTRNDAAMIPFSLMWAGFAVFWNVRVWLDGAPWFFRLWGLPFLLVGAYLVVGRFVVRQRRKRRLIYGLTDRRALILKSRHRTQCRASTRRSPRSRWRQPPSPSSRRETGRTSRSSSGINLGSAVCE
jgi:hypothetical protein